MTAQESHQKDLVVLTADKNAQFAIRGVLTRHQSLGIRTISNPDYVVHPYRDPGVRQAPAQMLGTFVKTHAHALVVMDREGSGGEHKTRIEMEEKIELALKESGWEDRAGAVVVDPELDVWVWSNSPHVETELGWKGKIPCLKDWLVEEAFIEPPAVKPARPKEALEEALWVSKQARSSALYKALAEKVSLKTCADPAFVKLKLLLQDWFKK